MITEPIKLYHGSYCEVVEPDLKQCRPGKDFGVGFYLTTSREQAISFTRTAIIKALQDGRISEASGAGFVSGFIFDAGKATLNVCEFANADQEWLHCVAAYRKSGGLGTDKWDDADLIIGKIANDKTNLVITAYLDGAYGEPGSKSADAIAISLLEPEKLKDQYCFRTQKAIDLLEFAGSERIGL